MTQEGHVIPLPANRCAKLELSPGVSLPSFAYFELTPVCNSNCVGCPNAMFASSLNPRRIKKDYQCNYLKGTQWKSVIKQLSPHLEAVNLTGGETTLHPDFEEIVCFLNDNEIDFIVFTNARWNKPQQLVSLLQTLKHFKGFLLSIHGASATTHELFTRVAGSFAEAVNNAQLAIQHDLSVTISTVITKANCQEIENIVELATNLHASEISFNRFLSPNLPEESDLSSDLRPSASELRSAVLAVESIKLQNRDVTPISYGPCIPQCFVRSSSEGCSAGESFFVIDPLGNVKPCTDAPFTCGNVLTDSMENIWMGAEMEYWRKLSNETCNSCSVLSICKTGCKAMAFTSGLRHDPLMMPSDKFTSFSLPVIDL